MKHRLSNETFAFVRGITLYAPGATIRDVRVGASRVQVPTSWDRPTYRLHAVGDRAVVHFDRPDNWAHFAFDILLDAPADGGVEPAVMGRLDTVAEASLEEVRQRLTQRRIAFLGTARNCASALPASVTKLHELAALFGHAEIHVYENDSEDGTGELLSRMAQQGLLQVQRESGIAQRMPLRTERLAYARNRLLDGVLARPQPWDYICWADLDGLVGARFTVEGFLSNFQLEEVWDAVFPISWPLYYDLWALREEAVCARDYVWDTQHRINAVLGDGGKLHAATQQLAPGKVRGWLPVQSAFGGFGLYKGVVARLGRYVGVEGEREVCEHVPYHEGLYRAGAKLYINPRCVTHIA